MNYAPIFAFRSAVAPRSLSLRTPAHFQLGSLLARLALARNSQLTSPTQRREVVYLLSSNMPTAFRSLTQDSLVYLLASAIPHLSFQGSPRSGSERTKYGPKNLDSSSMNNPLRDWIFVFLEMPFSRAGLLEMRPFGEAKSISGHQTLQLMKRPYAVEKSQLLPIFGIEKLYARTSEKGARVKVDAKFRIDWESLESKFKKSSSVLGLERGEKKVESEKAKAVEEPEEQNVSPVRSGRGKEETVAAELAKSVSIKEPRTQRRRRSQFTIDGQIDKDVADTIKASKLKSLKQTKQQVAGEGSSAAHTKYYANSEIDSDAILHSLCSDTSKESANETDDVDESDMDLTTDNPVGDDDAAGYGTLLVETPVNKLTNLMSRPVYTDTHTTSVLHNPEGNPEVRSFQSGASEVPFGTPIDVQATNLVLQEMFLGKADHHISSPPANTTYLLIKTPQPISLQAKAKKLMQKAKKNMRKINFKKAIAFHRL
ncbi:hypothetical protein Tco_0772824 [Tanacetum coccineum]|uniref:Uncharacterized protein n=1 Tax=Tanacetum coccineum TaxID=301880 RepID=A0ABQ4ZN33_9ASTR